MKLWQMMTAMVLSGALSACYVVPMESGSRVVQTSGNTTATTAVVPQSNTLQARLYPTNEMAQRYGSVNATVSIDQNGHGVFNAYIGGEQFTGDATRALNSRTGKANGSSASGRYIACDYSMNSATLGTGTCKMSTGAVFSMHIAR